MLEHVDAAARHIAEGAKGEKPISLTRPPLRFTYDPLLALRAAVRYRQSDYQWMPSIEDIADIDPAWETDVMTALELIWWHENALSSDLISD